jgi:hypothetical protein
MDEENRSSLRWAIFLDEHLDVAGSHESPANGTGQGAIERLAIGCREAEPRES